MKDWERIRVARTDLTDYVIHFTKGGLIHDPTTRAFQGYKRPIDVMLKILDDGVLHPSFAPRPNRTSNKPQNTIRGPRPAVCFTEQTLQAAIQSRSVTSRYSGYGIAYHKSALYTAGGRPVIYGGKDIIGRRIQPSEAGYVDGVDIFEKGLDPHYQHLWAFYEPKSPVFDEHPFDFTWEREWRIVPTHDNLPLVLTRYTQWPKNGLVIGAIIVEKDEDEAPVRTKLAALTAAGKTWTEYLQCVVSLETAEKKIAEGKMEYARIETWPTSTKLS